MVGLFDVVRPVWDRVPDPVQSGVRRTSPYRFLLRQFFEKGADFTDVEVGIDEHTATVHAPVSQHPYWNGYEEHGCHEPLATRTYFEEIETDDVVWDLGSKFGYEASIAIERTGDPATVHVFEVRTNSGVLLDYVSERFYDDRLNVVNRAVGAETTKQSVALDDYAAKYGAPDFVKIDIDGYEVLAMRGMKETVRRAKPTMLVEIHPVHIRRETGCSDEELVEFLTDVYDDVSICWEYRELDAEWKPFDEDEWETQRTYRASYQMLFGAD